MGKKEIKLTFSSFLLRLCLPTDVFGLSTNTNDINLRAHTCQTDKQIKMMTKVDCTTGLFFGFISLLGFVLHGINAGPIGQSNYYCCLYCCRLRFGFFKF
jgi:hypothetical protein